MNLTGKVCFVFGTGTGSGSGTGKNCFVIGETKYKSNRQVGD